MRRIVFGFLLLMCVGKGYATQCGPFINFESEFEKSHSVALVKAVSARVSYQDFISNFSAQRDIYRLNSDKEFSERLALEWSNYDESQRYAEFIVIKDFKGKIPDGELIRALDSLGLGAKYVAGNDYVLFLNGYDSGADFFGSEACFYVDATNKTVVADHMTRIDMYGIVMNTILKSHRKAMKDQDK